MTAYLVGFFFAVTLPLFVSSWRFAILGIAFQGFFVALVASGHHEPMSLSTVLRFLDLCGVRCVLVPALLYGRLKKLHATAEYDLIPANFVTWVATVALIIVAFAFGQRVVGDDLAQAFLLGAIANAILTGFVVLSLQANPFGQMIGLLTIESGISLFEVSLGHGQPWLLQANTMVLFVLTLMLLGKFVEGFTQYPTPPMDELTPTEPEVL